MAASSSWSDNQQKEQAGKYAPKVRELLGDYYGIPENHVVCAEFVEDGTYNTRGDYQSHHFDDYAGIDWKVDKDQMIFGVGQRIRPDHDTYDVDFSLRVENHTQSKPCEADRILRAMKNYGVFPRHYFFALEDEDKETLLEAYLLDTVTFMEAFETGELEYDVYRTDGDNGTKAAYIPPRELYRAGAILHYWTSEHVPNRIAEFRRGDGE